VLEIDLEQGAESATIARVLIVDERPRAEALNDQKDKEKVPAEISYLRSYYYGA
jgi:hypothetical protein